MFDLSLSPEQQAVEELFTSFFSKESPPSVARAAEPLGFDADLWRKLEAMDAPDMTIEGASLARVCIHRGDQYALFWPSLHRQLSRDRLASA